MKAGKLRHWLRFERKVTDVDSDGNLLETWVDAFAVNSLMPCELEPLSARELIAAQSMQSRVSARIVCRWRPGIDAAQRAVDPRDGAVYNFEGVVPDKESNREYVTIPASTGINEG